MHLTIPTMARGRRWAFAALLAALVLLAFAAPALAAKTPFDGGPITADTSTSVANDHTVYAMRFHADAGGANTLDANTTYYVKVRFSTDTATGQPSSTENRGFVWNDVTQKWVQEAVGGWTDFPSVTTDADGAIPQSPWIYYKFGDTAKTGEYALIVSLSVGVSGSTKNGTSWVNVDVFDPTDATNGGGWVHPGIDDSANAGRTGKVVDFAAPATLIALQRIEKNLCDDDNNGVVDDEQYGPVQDGSFDLAVPADRRLQAQVGGSKTTDWPDSDGFTLTVPDTDIALGASDMTAPSAPGALTAIADASGVELSWGAATDDTGVAGYNVYRAADADTGSGYTAPYVKVNDALVTGTTYTDDADVSGGASYHYIVRAVDAATNVGPRSSAAGGAPATLTMTRSANTVRYQGSARLNGELTSGVAVSGDEVVTVQMSADGATWSDAGAYDLLSGTGYPVSPLQKTYYRLVWAGDDAHLGVVSKALAVTPRVKLGRPVAPKTVRKQARFKVYGSLAPQHKAGRSYVAIKCYKKISGHWRLRKTVRAVDYDRGSATRYSVRFALTGKGSWKLVASYAATAKYAATTSSARYVRVK